MSLNAFVKTWLEDGSFESLQQVVSYLLQKGPTVADEAGICLLQYFGLDLPVSPSHMTVSQALTDLNPSPERLRTVWAQVLSLDEQPDSAHRIFVDRDVQFFVHIPSGKTIYSESLAVCLAQLSEHSAISFEQLLRTCFGIAPYFPWDHDTKIHNLVYRLRVRSFGELTFKTKNRKVFLTNGEGKIFVQRSCVFRSQCLQVNSRLFALVQNKESIETSVRILLATSAQVSRQTIQISTGLSKSTTQRVLNRMIAEGKINKIGSGKTASYRWVLAESDDGSPLSIQSSTHERKEKENSRVKSGLQQNNGGRNDF